MPLLFLPKSNDQQLCLSGKVASTGSLALWQAASPACPVCRHSDNQIQLNWIWVKAAKRAVLPSCSSYCLFCWVYFCCKGIVVSDKSLQTPHSGIESIPISSLCEKSRLAEQLSSHMTVTMSAVTSTLVLSLTESFLHLPQG